jgi:hypothetical protein
VKSEGKRTAGGRGRDLESKTRSGSNQRGKEKGRNNGGRARREWEVAEKMNDQSWRVRRESKRENEWYRQRDGYLNISAPSVTYNRFHPKPSCVLSTPTKSV